MSSRAWTMALVLWSGCTKPNPLSCHDGTCDDPRFPFCDVNGDIAGEPNTCIEGQCEPNVVAGCQGDDLVTCNANGTNFETEDCELGCQGIDATASCNLCEPNKASCDGDSISFCGADGRVASTEECAGTCVEDPDARCSHIIPRYLENVCDVAATTSLTIMNSASFDTDLDANCNGGIFLQGGGPAICVVRYATILLADGVDLRVVGGRALALVADVQVEIAGYLNLSAGDGFNGPGGGTVFSGVTGNSCVGCGLGGAGFASAGGDGGNLTTDGGASNGGVATGDPASLPVLVGGTQSGVSAQLTAGEILGGGGGAATIIACRGSISVTGEINAGGGGGKLGLALIGGAGGGAGGYVVLQGFAIQVTGKLFANGGGGGGGKPFDGIAMRGSDGIRGLTSAPGGFTTGGARGGSGGTGTSIPGDGQRQNAGGGTAAGGGAASASFRRTHPSASIRSSHRAWQALCPARTRTFRQTSELHQPLSV